MATKRTRKKKPEAGSRGLTPAEVVDGPADAAVATLAREIEASRGQALTSYRDPLGGNWLCLATLPIEAVAPTPFQRDLSETHAKRLAEAIDQVGCFVDPLVAVPVPEHVRQQEGARFWTPNGYHRLSAMRALGAKSIIALVSPDAQLAYRILALNTEKAHNVKERCLEAVRMARGLAELDDDAKEATYAVELQEPHLVTLGCAYEEKPRFAGGAYAAALKASEAFIEESLGQALAIRERRAARLLAVDERVVEIMADLKKRGFESPYLRNFVVARIRPFRPRGETPPDPEALLDHMEKAAARFDVERIKERDLAKTAGAAEE